jgi:glycosyltransferase involved in cell wall biosynthesis
MTAMSEEPVDVSVIVTTRGRPQGCQRLVQAVFDQFNRVGDLTCELVLVFDGCPAYGWVDTAVDRLHVQCLPSRVGIAQARNAGIGIARGRLVAFLDDDCVPAATWLADLLRMARRYPEHVAFGGKVIGTDAVNLYARLRELVYYYETFGAWYVDRDAHADVVGAPYVNGGNGAYRRDALLGAGGFDAILPAYSDVELGRRLGLEERAVLCPGMAIHHDHPGDFRQYMLRCWRSGQARALLWARRGYRQDSPAAVGWAIVCNIAWNNFVGRRRRLNAPPVRVVSVLLCQEVVHGLGYARALIGGGCGRGWRARGRNAAASLLGGLPDSS